jgi:DNA-binding beta-propeller fold protein YncE
MIGMKTNRNMLSVDQKTGDVFLLDSHGALNSDNAYTPVVYHYKGDGTLVGSWQDGVNYKLAGYAMALDDKTENLAYVEIMEEGIYVTDQSGNLYGGGSGNKQWGLDVVAKGGYAVSTQPEVNSLLGMDIINDPFLQNPLTYSLLQDPCAITMAQDGSKVDTLVFSCGSNTISRISVPDMTLKGALVINEVTLVGSGDTAVHIAALSSGTVAVMSPVDGKLFLVDLESMTQIGNSVTLDGYPDGIVANETANAFEITFASSPQALPTGAELVDTTGNVTKLKLSSNNFPLGIGVSPDGTKLYVGDRAGKLDIQNNQ